jgi:hypothetical protein
MPFSWRRWCTLVLTSMFRRPCASKSRSRDSAACLDSQLAYLATSLIPYRTITLERDAPNPAKARQLIAYHLATNLDLDTMLESVVSTWPMIYDAAIVDADGKAILHSEPDRQGRSRPS